MNSEVLVSIITGAFGLVTGVATVWLTTRKSKNIDQNDEAQMLLKDHHFFIRLDALCDNVNRTFSLANKGKEAVFKDIITNQLELYKEKLGELATEVDSGCIVDCQHLYNRNLQCFNSILNSLHTYYKNNQGYTVEEQEVLDIVMKKYETWHQDKIDYILENLMMACNSPFYDTIQIRTAVVLDLYLGAAIDTINYAEKTLNHINGDLKGLRFKGVQI